MDNRLKSVYSAIDLLPLEPEERDAAWDLYIYITCGSHGLVKTFTANELEEGNRL